MPGREYASILHIQSSRAFECRLVYTERGLHRRILEQRFDRDTLKGLDLCMTLVSVPLLVFRLSVRVRGLVWLFVRDWL